MFYTILIISLNVIVAGGGSNLFLPEEFPTFTTTDIKDRIFGSKIVVISEQVSTHACASCRHPVVLISATRPC